MCTKINIVENSADGGDLTYGIGESEFGQIFIVLDEIENIYYSAFIDDTKAAASELNIVKKTWPRASLLKNDIKVAKIISKIFDKNYSDSLNLKLTGTEFQQSVWRTIANLKEGSTASYEDLAKAIGNPKAIRAVASAVTKNKLAYLIPCHRVISKSGGISKYKWGGHRKIKLLTQEKAI